MKRRTKAAGLLVAGTIAGLLSHPKTRAPIIEHSRVAIIKTYPQRINQKDLTGACVQFGITSVKERSELQKLLNARVKEDRLASKGIKAKNYSTKDFPEILKHFEIKRWKYTHNYLQSLKLNPKKRREVIKQLDAYFDFNRRHNQVPSEAQIKEKIEGLIK